MNATDRAIAKEVDITDDEIRELFQIGDAPSAIVIRIALNGTGLRRDTARAFCAGWIRSLRVRP